MPDILDSLSFHTTKRSGNTKTGPIAVTTTGAQSCPDTCPFKSNGCYASGGPLALHWAAVTAGRRGSPWREHLAALQALPDGQALRLNQAGDLPATNERLSVRYLRGLRDAVQHLRCWTYSHHPLNRWNLKALQWFNRTGSATINVSTETESAADAAVAQGLPAVLTVDSEETRRHWRTAAGNVVHVCPAQLRDTTCSDCMLCHKRGRRVIIAFKAHGNARKRVNSALAAAHQEAPC
jgi:hypothetical protein